MPGWIFTVALGRAKNYKLNDGGRYSMSEYRLISMKNGYSGIEYHLWCTLLNLSFCYFEGQLYNNVCVKNLAGVDKVCSFTKIGFFYLLPLLLFVVTT